MQNIVVWAGILGSVFGVATAVVGLIAIYRSSIRKSYAAEREFLHIKESFKSLTYNIDFLIKEINRDNADLTKNLDARCDRIDQNLLEIKALQLSNLGMKPNP